VRIASVLASGLLFLGTASNGSAAMVAWQVQGVVRALTDGQGNPASPASIAAGTSLGVVAGAPLQARIEFDTNPVLAAPGSDFSEFPGAVSLFDVSVGASTFGGASTSTNPPDHEAFILLTPAGQQMLDFTSIFSGPGFTDILDLVFWMTPALGGTLVPMPAASLPTDPPAVFDPFPSCVSCQPALNGGSQLALTDFVPGAVVLAEITSVARVPEPEVLSWAAWSLLAVVLAARHRPT
jgi:hypothetical protein